MYEQQLKTEQIKWHATRTMPGSIFTMTKPSLIAT
jgi:hypothetical protein